MVGVGGGGGNAVAHMVNAGVDGVDFITANTDSQALAQSSCDRRIQLGVTVTQGLGAGSRPDIGRIAAEEALEHVFIDRQRVLRKNWVAEFLEFFQDFMVHAGVVVIGAAQQDHAFVTESGIAVRAAMQIEHLAYYDGLTALPNRELFMDRLQGAITRAREGQANRPTVIFIDIDRFKNVNKSFGLVVGDSMLLTLARRLVQMPPLA